MTQPLLTEYPTGDGEATPITAVVHTDGTETRYQRAGSGPPVLLLVCGGAAAVARSQLIRELAGSCRVIAPELPDCSGHTPAQAGNGDPATWLRNVIDGLGLMRPSILADDGLALACIAFAMADPHRVGRIVIASRAPLLGAAGGGALEDVLGSSGHPFLLLQLESGKDGPVVSPSTVVQIVTFVHSASL